MSRHERSSTRLPPPLPPIPAPHVSSPRRKSKHTVKIGGDTFHTSEVFDTFFWFVCERHQVFRRRLEGQEWPWTEDATLSSHRFINVFRVYDRLTQYVLTHVIGSRNWSLKDAFFRVLVFRTFGKIETWEFLEEQLGTITADGFDPAVYDRVLSRLINAGRTLYQSAYIMPAPSLGYEKNHSNHLRLIRIMMSLRVYDKLKRMHHLKDAHGYLILYPSMGEFTTMQLLLDLNMLPHYDWDENEWVGLGPGSKSCLQKMFGPGIKGREEAAVRYIRDTQFDHFSRLGYATEQIPRLCAERAPGLTMVDIEHALCECEKYSRAAFPHIRGRRVSAGRPYVPKTEAVTAALPDKWREPLVPREWTKPAPVDGQDLYEISHIVREISKSDSARIIYQVRWMDWGVEHDTNLDEEAFEGAKDVLHAWRLLKAEVEESIEMYFRRLG